jgi:hypothetical protein
MDNPENLATLGTQDPRGKQTKQKHNTLRSVASLLAINFYQ